MKWIIAVRVNGIEWLPRPDPRSGTAKPDARGDDPSASDSQNKSTYYQRQRSLGCMEVAILADISLRIRGKPLP
jgi:hypothetical protein